MTLRIKVGSVTVYSIEVRLDIYVINYDTQNQGYNIDAKLYLNAITLILSVMVCSMKVHCKK